MRFCLVYLPRRSEVPKNSSKNSCRFSTVNYNITHVDFEIWITRVCSENGILILLSPTISEDLYTDRQTRTNKPDSGYPLRHYVPGVVGNNGGHRC